MAPPEASYPAHLPFALPTFWLGNKKVEIMADIYVVKSGVVLHNFAKHYVDRVANSFQKSTGKILVVTSGYRGPSQQAGEMYKKFQGPEANIYRDKVALAEIREVYERDVTARKSRDETIAGMAAVIESQVREHALSPNIYLQLQLIFGSKVCQD